VTKSVRRVVSGFDESGRSVWIEDDFPESHTDVGRPGYRMTDLWRVPKCPPRIGENHSPGAVEYWPETGGLVFRTAEIPPRSGRGEMHTSQTIDLMVIISGELWGYQEHTNEAILLKQGDTLIQCGTSHAWENKSDAPCLFAVVLLGAIAK
jgi:hypothetical protein